MKECLRLPSKQQILSKLLYHYEVEKLTIKESYECTILAALKYWNMVGIPTTTKRNVWKKAKLEKLFQALLRFEEEQK